MAALQLMAGENALSQIREHGLRPALFDFMLGASGGPKWFVLAGLDRVIMPQFFAGRQKPLDILGSSAGSFRFACYAQRDPLAAINRLAEHYSHTVYTDKPDRQEISEKGWALMDHFLGEHGAQEIASNPVVRAHFVVARSKGIIASERTPLQVTGLLASALANRMSRKTLDWFYHRHVFSSSHSTLQLDDPYQLAISQHPLTPENLPKALMASGSIPVVLEGVENIPDAPLGMYRDGGIIDYHFDMALSRPDSPQGLVLYPHFFDQPIPGWFDKSNKKRRPHRQSFERVLKLVPSAEFIASLPYGKIPDRKDFESLDATTRIKYWQTVLSESDRLGEEFMNLVEKQDVAHLIKPIDYCIG